MPNITGTVGGGIYAPASECGYQINNSVPYESGSYRGAGGFRIGFAASRSNTIYGNANTVTPLSLSTKFFIKY